MASNTAWLVRATRLIKRRLRELDSRFVELKASVKDGERGPAGPKGPEGPPGPKGDKPDHQWRGPELRFEKPDGTWGKWANLQGPAGKRGGGGGSGGSFSPGALAKLILPVKDTDNLLIERNGTAYRVSVLELKDVFGQGGGQGDPEGTVYIGEAPLYMGYETMKMGE